MRNDTLTVWLEAVPDDGVAVRTGMLCRRHADAMIVPRGWTLDDRRESSPRLFRISDPAPPHEQRGRRKKSPQPIPVQQLSFDTKDTEDTEDTDDTEGAKRLEDPAVEPVTVADLQPPPAEQTDPDETQAIPWRFVYDAADDLGGVLSAKSPLLSRAFRGGVKRPRD